MSTQSPGTTLPGLGVEQPDVDRAPYAGDVDGREVVVLVDHLKDLTGDGQAHRSWHLSSLPRPGVVQSTTPSGPPQPRETEPSLAPRGPAPESRGSGAAARARHGFPRAGGTRASVPRTRCLGFARRMAEVIFFIAAIGAIAGAVGTVSLRNPFFSVLALVVHLLSLAALFLLLRAEFIAAAQVIVYAGAVMVLYVFVVAYIGGSDEPLAVPGGPGLRWVSMLFAGALFVELSIAVLGSGLSALDGEGSGFFAGVRVAGADRRAVPDDVPARLRDRLGAAARGSRRRRHPRAPAQRARRAAGGLGGRARARARPRVRRRGHRHARPGRDASPRSAGRPER